MAEEWAGRHAAQWTEWHVVPRGDRYIAENGSAILGVCKALSEAAQESGVDSTVIVDRDAEHQAGPYVRAIRYHGIRESRIGRLVGKARLVGLGTGYADGLDIDYSGDSPAVIYLHNRPWAVGAFRERFPDAFISLYLHNSTMRGVPPRSIRRCISNFDQVVCVSDYLRNDLIRRAKIDNGMTAAKVIVVNNAVDSTRFSKVTPVDCDVLYVGRVIPEKGLKVLLDCLTDVRLSKVRTKVLGGHTFLPGNLSDYELECRNIVESNKLHVEFLGPLSPSRVPEFMNRSKILVVPSTWDDPCPLVVLEGRASRAAVVASRVGGIPEIGDCSRGVVLFNRGDSLSLADILVRLLRDESARLQIVTNGQSTARAWTWGDAYAQLRASRQTTSPARSIARETER